MIELCTSRMHGSFLSTAIKVIVECLNVNTNQPYFRYTKNQVQADEPAAQEETENYFAL